MRRLSRVSGERPVVVARVRGCVAVVVALALVVTVPEAAAVAGVLAFTGQSDVAVKSPDSGDVPGGGLSAEQTRRLATTVDPLPVVKPKTPKGDYSSLLSLSEPKPLPKADDRKEPVREALDVKSLDVMTRDFPVESRDEFSTTYQQADGSKFVAGVG